MFRVGSPVLGEDFIDRETELRQLAQYMNDRQNVILMAPRRYGKSSLILEAFRQQGGPNIYVDLKYWPDLERLSAAIIDSSYRLLGIENFIRQTKESITRLLRHLRVKFRAGIPDLAEVTIELIESKKDPVELFMHAIDLPDTVGARLGKTVCVAYDEFQDILNFGVPAVLDRMRSALQRHRNASYIFAGSQESLMTRLFQNKASAFFHFGRIIRLPGLDIDVLCLYAQQKLKEKHISADGEALRDFLSTLGGHPFYSMKTLQSLYYLCVDGKRRTVGKDDMSQALLLSFEETRSYLEDIVSRLRLKKHHTEVLFAIANGVEPGVNPLVLYKTCTSLEEMGFLKREGRGKYTIDDPFLRIYLTRQLLSSQP